MGLLERISNRREPERMNTDQYLMMVGANALNGGYMPGIQQTLSGNQAEKIGPDLVAYAQSAYASNGPVFSCMLVRQSVFSTINFRWQRVRAGRGSDMFGTPELGLLERPWAGGTTQDLLNRIIQDSDLSGNAFNTLSVPLSRLGGDNQPEIVRLRPDWVDIVVAPRFINGGKVGWRKVGYVYTEGGYDTGNEPVPLLLDEVSHFAPIPDPLASWRGMSWLTPVIREIINDKLMGTHQRKFFENGATPNMVVTLPAEVRPEALTAFRTKMEASHRGVENAYKTLYLGAGADVTVVGSNFEQMTFNEVQGRGETRIAAAAGVPPVIAGFSEGLAAATYSNYAQARRRFADGTMHPLWQNVSGSLAPLLTSPGPDARLWYDATDVPFLREDEKDHAEIQQMQAATIRQLIDAGYVPESVTAAVDSGDWRLLVHSGLYSVQLQAAGSTQTPDKPKDDGSSTNG